MRRSSILSRSSLIAITASLAAVPWVIHFRDGCVLPYLWLPFIVLLGAGAGFAIYFNSKRAEAEDALKNSEAMKSAVLNGALEGIFAFDAGGRIVEYNRAAEEMFEFARRGENFFNHPNVRALLPLRYCHRYARQTERFSRELPTGQSFSLMAIRADGSEFPVEVALTQIRHGDRAFCTAFVRDVTQRRLWKKEIIEAREEAIRASMAKTEFLANMSHEIRTPLNAIIGMTDLLIETPLAEDQEKYLRICKRASRTLLNIVNDVLDLSKIESGQLKLEKIDFDLHALVESVSEMMAVRAHEKGLSLTLHIRSDVPRVVKGDLNRIRQILLSLVGNAIKFTKKGEVNIRVEVDSSLSIAFLIRDTGIGITDAQMAHIFEKFTQADSSMTRKHGGTGLGLAICKRLVDAMGGSIVVQSRLELGSEFRIVLPMETANRIHLVKRHDYFSHLDGKRALIICENVGTRVILRELLSGWGAQIDETAGLREANARLSALQYGRGSGYDFTFVDDRLPEFARNEVSGSLFSDMRSQAPFPLGTCILLTGAGSQRAKTNAGLADVAVLHRPIQRSNLMEVVAECVGQTVPRNIQNDMKLDEQVGNGALMMRDVKGKLLLVEDSPDNQALIHAYFRGIKADLDVAWNGEEAYEKFCRGSYSLVLMDMQMPVMDGYSATRKMREFEAASGRAKTPILALTAHALDEEIKKSLDAGCDGHLAKPVRKQQLLETIEIFTKEVNDAGGAIERRIADNVGGETRPGSRRLDSVVHAEQAE